MKLYALQPGQSVTVKTRLAWLSSNADKDGVEYSPSLEVEDAVVVKADEGNTGVIYVSQMEEKRR